MKRILVLSALMLCAVGAQAQGATTFSASVTSANGSLSTKLTWNAPGSPGCTASGHPSWTGAKPASGSLDLPAITMSGTYSLKISCAAAPVDDKATLAWIPPTLNVDGTALTNLAKYRIWRTNSQATIGSGPFQEVNVGTNTYVYTNLPAGQTYWYIVKAVNAAGAESAASNIASKTQPVAGVAEEQSVSLTVNPVPQAATGLSIT